MPLPKTVQNAYISKENKIYICEITLSTIKSRLAPYVRGKIVNVLVLKLGSGF